MKVDSARIHRLFYPQVPAVLSSSSEGRVSAMPVVSYASVSAAPPLVVVACEPSSFTLKLALKSNAFSLCLLGEGDLPAMEQLGATSGGTVKDKLASAKLAHRRGKVLDVPVISGAEATLECSIAAHAPLGDHVLLTGLVKAVYSSGKFGEFWDFRRYKPILYSGWREGMTTYRVTSGRGTSGSPRTS